MTPVSMIYFFVIDIIFMVYVLASTILYFISCTKIDIKDVVDDLVFKNLLGMNRMQIIGLYLFVCLFFLLFFGFGVVCE